MAPGSQPWSHVVHPIVAAIVAAAAPMGGAFVDLPFLGMPEPLMAPASGGAGAALAPLWAADFAAEILVGPKSKSKSWGHFAYDRQAPRYRQRMTMEMGFFHPGESITYDILTTNRSGLNENTTVGARDEVCKPMMLPYMDPFAWLDSAHRNGSTVVDGEPCDLWVGVGVSLFTVRGVANMSLCIGQRGEPRAWNVTAFQQIGGGIHMRQLLRFANFTWGSALPPDTFAPSPACQRFPLPRCADGGVRTLDLYRIHSTSEPMSLLNRNLGDALGDMAFLCQVNGVRTPKTNVVTWWQLDVATDFGQYANCLFGLHHRNECFGGTDLAVGRSSAEGMGRGQLQGQCSPNDDVGSWYSLPEDGACKPGEAVGTGGCTWGRVKRMRTVSATCILQERGLLQSCAEEVGHAPFKKSEAIFLAALASDDASKGGCPDIDLPQEGAEFIVV